jgi:hypothetical protein
MKCGCNVVGSGRMVTNRQGGALDRNFRRMIDKIGCVDSGSMRAVGGGGEGLRGLVGGCV